MYHKWKITVQGLQLFQNNRLDNQVGFLVETTAKQIFSMQQSNARIKLQNSRLLPQHALFFIVINQKQVHFIAKRTIIPCY